ncbi:uncharacterized protein LOC130646104 [Hydractinia symbiolongicarpus]|uniref:uncharacterized protein LOC130646104 n=1 Tax=Hydractinia symbiolongicarpus TaxID=13093 RepID=UPI00254A5A8D|nr:uncharacterized protein LOC130646104 [Hydractinia symbiolongicarpus]
MASVFQGSDVDDVLDRMFAQIKTGVENPALPRSGFTISKILYLDADFHKMMLTKGSLCIELTKWVASRKAIINPKNEDEECFKLAIIASLHHEEIEKNPQRIGKLRPHVGLYNWKGIKFPTSNNSTYKFEANNFDIVVNVLYIHGKKINILRRSVQNGRTKAVNLLLITDDKKTHYTAVKSLSRLLGKETSKDRNAMHNCLNCLQAFPTVELRYCINHDAVKITMPNEAEKWLYYRDEQQQLKVPFAIYADFESLLVLVEDTRDTKIKRLNKHVPSGWCTYSTFAYVDVPDPLTVYRGEDYVTRFVNHLEDEVKRLCNIYSQRDMKPLTEVLKREHDKTTHCHICLKRFDNYENNRKVSDHCHYTGLYRRAAHNSYNLNYKIPSHIPVIFHAVSGYDAHLLIRELGGKYDIQNIGWIAENTEKYISFNVKIKVPLGGMGYGDGKKYKTIEMRFIDSCQFMASSLDKLARNLIGTNAAGTKCHQCADTCLEFQSMDAEYMAKFWCKNCDSSTIKQLNRDRVKANVPSMAEFIDKDDVFRLMLRKSVYPYENMDGWRRFEEVKLPPEKAFYSKLNMKGISDRDYAYAKKMGIEGGKTHAVHRYSKASNKYMGDQYDSEAESSHLQYLDANNLYEWAMRQDLPTDGFKRVSNVEAFTERRIEKLVEGS